MRIDGKEIAQRILDNLKKQKVTAHLAIVLVDHDPASAAYVRQKELKAKKIGCKTTICNLEFGPPVGGSELITLINQLNKNKKVHGIIVQQPLPPQIDVEKITEAINPEKDIDGFHPKTRFKMPIALAVLTILEEIYNNEVKVRGDLSALNNWLKRKNIVIIGKGKTGGGPIIEMFKKMGIEPSVIDSKTINCERLTKKADLIISAVGKSSIVKARMIKRGVILISVGLHKEADGKLHGDYEENEIKNIASFYTPTPGGVGPVNVACLLKNLIQAATRQNKT